MVHVPIVTHSSELSCG